MSEVGIYIYILSAGMILDLGEFVVSEVVRVRGFSPGFRISTMIWKPWLAVVC